MSVNHSYLSPGDGRPFTELLAARVRGQMAERGLRQADLAPVLGISQQSVSKRLDGKVPFDVNELAVVAGWLGMSVGRLLGEVADYPGPGPGNGPITRQLPRDNPRLLELVAAA